MSFQSFLSPFFLPRLKLLLLCLPGGGGGENLMLQCGTFLDRVRQIKCLHPFRSFCGRQFFFFSSRPTTTTTLCSNHHHDLSSFISYARRNSLSPRSTTYTGTRYEYIVQETLQRKFGFCLTRVGGRDDLGIDLSGSWDRIPRLPAPLKFVVQCKAFKSKVGPNLVRELEGAVAGTRRWSNDYNDDDDDGGGGGGGGSGRRAEKVFGILASPRHATKGVREAMGKSRQGLVWMMVEEVKEGERERERQADEEEAKEEAVADQGIGKVRQVLWNRVAADMGLEGVTVAMRYPGKPGEKMEDDPRGEGMEGECVLMWGDQPIQSIST